MAVKNNRVKSTSDLELKDRLVAINRVTKVTKGGRTFTFSAIVVVGNENGIVGWGLGKAGEVTAAIAKGVEAAKKNLIKVPSTSISKRVRISPKPYPLRQRCAKRLLLRLHHPRCLFPYSPAQTANTTRLRLSATQVPTPKYSL